MQSETLRQLEIDYPTLEEKKARLTEIIDNFGDLDVGEMKFTVGDILCLAMLLYEVGEEDIIYDLRNQLNELERSHRQERRYLSKLEYLSKCLTNFRPSIFRNIQEEFANKYSIDTQLVICMPKITGQQIGTKVEVKRTIDDLNPMIFHVKSHQEFCSKSDPFYIAITSDGTGQVDFKELFMYKVLEYIGYGPKTHFIIDKDISQSRVEEGILIATEELGYTEKIERKSKVFETFGEIRRELSSTLIESIDEATKRDIIAIDMLSRAFLLEDVMVNQGNFGRVTASMLFEPPRLSIKWKVVDFRPPKLDTDKFDDYSYKGHYGGSGIFYSFKVRNVSHSYGREELRIIGDILSEASARELWHPIIEQLFSDRPPHHFSIVSALEKAFDDVHSFMETNRDRLQINPDRLSRRMSDLASYKVKILENFEELRNGIIQDLAGEASVLPQPA